MDATVTFESFRMVPLEKFLPELRFEFTDLPDALFKYAVIRAARVMAQDGNLIRRKAVIHTKPGVTRYALRSPDGLEICSILGAKASSCCTSDHRLTRYIEPPRRSCHVCGKDAVWYDDQEEVLHIEAWCHYHEVYVTVAVCPPDDACELPAAYYDDYIEVLLQGAKARILRMNNKPWTNLQLANAYEKNFVESIAYVAVEAQTHKMRGSFKINFGRIM